MPELSVIVIFHNMRREAQRTLFSLSAAYQRNVDSSQWEVIAVDNGSDSPLQAEEVNRFGENFRYYYYETDSMSPVAAINFAVSKSRSENIAVCIDGARIASPGLLQHSLHCLQHFSNPFVCTLGWHLGDEVQNISMLKGYNQQVEDKLLKNIEWRKQGYDLFTISSLAASSNGGFFSSISESNFCSLRKSTYQANGGFDERFTAPGGGTANLDFYKRIAELTSVQTIHLLGEGTFHQFHGGVATNVPLADHPATSNRAQYREIRGKDFEIPKVSPLYYGHMPRQALRFA